MKKLCLCLALVGLLGLGGQAFAVIGTIDAVPASTLLVPYFEVDINNANGVNTLFSINNASATAVLAHVTIWTDQSVPALDFDVYLTGYDVQTISLRDIFVNGRLPATAPDFRDPDDEISPQGPVSSDSPTAPSLVFPAPPSGGAAFSGCANLPYGANSISPSFLAHLQAWFQGNVSPATGNCAGSKQQDGILRGYITVDTVNDCNLFFPSDFALYAPFLTYQNVLWGDVFYTNEAENFAQGETAVHIEACAPGAPCFFTGDHTFYGRYNAASAADQREALPTTMAARFLNGGPFSGGTDFIVWREANAAAAGYSCSLQGPSSWYPLEAAQIVIFDEEEQPVTADDCPSGDPTCEQEITIPNEAQRVDVAGDLLSPFNFGWAYMNLQHPDVIPAYGDQAAQSWVMTVMDASGRFSVGFDGVQLDNANAPVTTFIPVP